MLFDFLVVLLLGFLFVVWLVLLGFFSNGLRITNAGEVETMS